MTVVWRKCEDNGKWGETTTGFNFPVERRLSRTRGFYGSVSHYIIYPHITIHFYSQVYSPYPYPFYNITKQLPGYTYTTRNSYFKKHEKTITPTGLSSRYLCCFTLKLKTFKIDCSKEKLIPQLLYLFPYFFCLYFSLVCNIIFGWDILIVQI